MEHETGLQPGHIVGIGASAGGLEALERLFQKLPGDTGMAFVIVQHLSPDFDSVMDELLGRQTPMPVRTVTNGMVVEPDSIYLIPPKKEMIISEGKLLLTDKDPLPGLNLPIDILFRSLAQDAGSRSIAIVLSGTGSDGSRGIRDVHEAGGLVLVQSEETAKFDGMPRSAVETGVVDLILSPEEMAAALVRYARHPIVGDLAARADAPPVDDDGMNRLLRLLRDSYGIDFSLYKPSTVSRRIERRLLLNQSVDFEQYVEQVASDAGELNSLYRDLLIGVTQFFRDPEAFAHLQTQVLPELIDKHPPGDELRIWVAGCATGEEAYSIAILVHEELSRRARPVNVKIFATDVHRTSLDFASAGLYPEASLTTVSSERLTRYFTRRNEHYQVSAELRQLVVFAPHNVVKDAPFTRLDLISCRNLLIYLQAPAQKKALSLFHFGLKTGGVLFLGPSEGPGDLEDEFKPIERHWKIFRKRRDVRLSPDLRLPMAGLPARPLRSGPPAGNADLAAAFEQLLGKLTSAALLLDDRRQLLHVFGSAGAFLHIRAGRPSDDVLEYLEPDLKTAVSGALQCAGKEHTSVWYSGVEVSLDGDKARVKLGVIPAVNRQSEVTHYLIVFEPLRAPALPPEPQLDVPALDHAARERIELLESELRHTRENLQATIEELETSNEELQATNEELVASNEELQSTNEELHSVNEELYTVNAEYQRKIGELTELTEDMDNLLRGTDVGVLFLDRELRIRKFTPRLAQSFNILDQDVGRPFDNFTHHFEPVDIRADARRVLDSGQLVEKEVSDRNQHWYLLRILPYRSKGKLEGVVLTLIDIDLLKRAQANLWSKENELQGILNNAPAFIFMKDLEGRYLLVNGQVTRVFGLERDQVLGKTDRELLPHALADQLAAQEREVSAGGQAPPVEIAWRNGPRRCVYVSILYPLRDETGRISAVAGIWTDITQQKRAEQRSRGAVQQRDQFLATLSHELRNPLAAVQSAVEVLRRQPEAPVSQRVIDTIARQAAQMARLLDDLLEVSRITQGKIELRNEVFDLRDSARDALDAVRAMAQGRELQLQLHLCPEPLYVNGDPARLQQVQVNLLINAIKYTPPGGAVELRLERKDDHAALHVRDTGMGMSRRFLKRAFDLFVQGDATLARSDGGMGVGLTLVRALVAMHGGSVTAHSDGPGRGSLFSVELPISTFPPTVAATSQPAPAFQNSAALHVLLVEDNADAREMLRTLLELSGYRVDTAADGQAALAAIAADMPDVALLDIGLPGLDGYELAQEIRRRHPGSNLVLVALTGYGQPRDRERSQEAGFDEHLVKPVDFTELQRLLTRLGAARGVPS